MRTLLRLALLTAFLLVAVPTVAQENNIINLNDLTPAIDALINLPANASGTIALDFSGVSVKLTDTTGAMVFFAADSRLHGLQLNIAPNTGAHTLTVERLPGIATASVRVTSLPELTYSGMTSLVESLVIGLNQEVSMPLDSNSPGGSVLVSLPTTSVLTATFPGAGATSQMVDSNGTVMVQSVGGHVDGINMTLDSGEYQFTVLGSQMSTPTKAGVRAVSTLEAGVEVLSAPSSESSTTTIAQTTQSAESCIATIGVSSANLRSGPGTGYTVLEYGYRNQTFPVGGQNPSSTWFVIGTNNGSAWVAGSNLQMQGNCSALTTYNVPLKNAQAAEVIYETVSVTNNGDATQNSGSGSNNNGGSGSSGGNGEPHDDSHEGDD